VAFGGGCRSTTSGQLGLLARLGYFPLPGRCLRRSIPPGGGPLDFRRSTRTSPEVGNASRNSRSSLSAVSNLFLVFASSWRLDAMKSVRSLRSFLVRHHQNKAMTAAIAPPMPICSSAVTVSPAAEQMQWKSRAKCRSPNNPAGSRKSRFLSGFLVRPTFPALISAGGKGGCGTTTVNGFTVFVSNERKACADQRLELPAGARSALLLSDCASFVTATPTTIKNAAIAV
jgi:hypothetical protein